MKNTSSILTVSILFFGLFIAESVVSQVIPTVFSGHRLFWFEAVVNASLQALLSLLLLRFILAVGGRIRHKKRTREWLYLQLGLSVFGIELLLVLLFSIFQMEQLFPQQWQPIKALLFATISSIAVYIYVLAPSQHKITRFLNRIEVRYSTSYLFAMSLLLGFVANIYQQEERRLTTELLDYEAEQLALIDKTLTYRISEAVLDTLTLATQPDFIRHLGGDHLSIEEVKLEFSNVVQTKQSYDQIRFIDADGYERIRVNKGLHHAEAVPEDQLQYKQDRYYVPETGRLDHGKVYISPLDLNVEFGEIELPHKPITRIATPVKDEHGRFLGLIVINLMAEHLLQYLDDANELSKGQINLLNQQGFWMHGDMQTPPKWAFMFSDELTDSLAQKSPTLWKQIQQHSSGHLRTEEGAYIFHKVKLSDHQRIQSFEQAPFTWPIWTLMTKIDNSVITQLSLQKLHLFMLVCALLALVSGIGTYLYTLSQLKRNSAENRVQHMADHDPLTGLYNRRNLMQQLESALIYAREQHETVAVFYLDLDNFKPINDRLGHEVGDEVLKRISNRLTQMLRQSDTLARIGGDEFVILIRNPDSIQRLKEIASRIVRNLKQPIHLENVECQLGVSVGVAISRDNLESRDALLKAADMLMLEAKREGKSCYRIAELDSIQSKESLLDN